MPSSIKCIVQVLFGILCFHVSSIYPLRAQNKLAVKPPVQLIDVEKGLPQAFVSGVAIDDEGFTWISTLGGLARYDGQRMLAFKHKPGDSTSIADNLISTIVKGRTNELWLLYESGTLDRLNTQSGQCSHIRHFAQSLSGLTYERYLCVDQRGNLWGIIKNQGAFCYDPQRNKLTRLRRANHRLLSDSVAGVINDSQGKIWFVTQKGLSQYDPATGQSSQVPYSLHFNAVTTKQQWGGDLTSMVVLPNGDISFTDRNRLIFFTPATRTFRSLPLPNHQGPPPRWLVSSSDGTVYIVVDDAVYRCDQAHGLLLVWQYESTITTASFGLACSGLAADQANCLWVGANTTGLFRLDLTAIPLIPRRYQVTFCYDALKEGLGVDLAAHFRWPFRNIEAPSSYSFRSTYDSHQRLWMAIGKEVGWYDLKTRTLRLIASPASSLDRTDHGDIVGLSVSDDGRLWIALADGTSLYYEFSTRRWHNIRSHPPLESASANYLLADSNALWITTTTDGLLRLDRLDGQTQRIFFTKIGPEFIGQRLLYVTRDPTRSELLWIGSHEGLICFNKRTRRYRTFGTAQGLPNSTVYTIVPDGQGYLWLSTNRGLCRFHPITNTVLPLGTADGTPGVEFNRYHDLRFPDGRLAFGGVKGWTLFDPARIRPDTTTPTVVLTDLTLNNQPVEQYGLHTLFAHPINYLSELRLSHNQNYLSIDFAALNYHQPDRVTYRYQLQGYDDGWITSRRPAASYTRLPPGRYLLRVNAANEAGRWSHQVKELVVVVLPPAWASGWAYGLYSILIGSTIIGVIRYRAKRTHEREQLALRERQAEELRQADLAKTRFFANMSHELRTPLTLMMGPLSSVLNRQRMDSHDERLIRMADSSARQLLDLVDQLMSLTRLEAKSLVLQPQPIRLSTWLHACIAPFAQQAQQMNIQLTSELSIPEEQAVWIDPGKVQQILQNLLINACKFTPPGGSVTIRAVSSDQQFQLSIQDTGRGIHPDDLPHIFDRYFQTHQTDIPLEGGTGIGLALCQELIRLMHGTIMVESTWQRGSVFTVNLPIHNVNGPTLQKKDIVPATNVYPDNYQRADQLTAAGQTCSESRKADTILIVEDNVDLRFYLETILSPLYPVLTAANGQLALQLLTELPKPPALIIADIMMPVMDGFQLLETLKSIPAFRLVPVIMLTARTDMSDRLRALRLGVDDYLLKPFTEAELTTRISALLYNQRERQRQHTGDPVSPDEQPASTNNVSGIADQGTIDLTVSLQASEEDLDWLKRLEVAVNNRLGEVELTAESLADAMAMSRRTFYRTVSRLTGMTPAQYLTEARFNKARHLLENRQVSSVKQVALEVGFRKVSYFTQIYQQRFGKKPSDYL